MAYSFKDTVEGSVHHQVRYKPGQQTATFLQEDDQDHVSLSSLSHQPERHVSSPEVSSLVDGIVELERCTLRLFFEGLME